MYFDQIEISHISHTNNQFEQVMYNAYKRYLF